MSSVIYQDGDPSCFPLYKQVIAIYEIVYKFNRPGMQVWYDEIKQKATHHFIEPFGEVSGFIITNLVHGTRRVRVGVVGHGAGLEMFIFYIQDPGIELDYERVASLILGDPPERLKTPVQLTYINSPGR